jgi:WXG100 family type VII secretion target
MADDIGAQSANATDLATLATAAQDVRATEAGLRKDLAEVESIVAFLRNTWDSEAARSFEKNMTLWTKDATDLVDGLKHFAAQLDAIRLHKNTTEEHVSSSIGAYQTLNQA